MAPRILAETGTTNNLQLYNLKKAGNKVCGQISATVPIIWIWIN